jgi:ferredoxin
MDLEGEPCQQTEIRETCLLFGDFAKETVASGVGRSLSKEEMLGMIERANEIGQVLQPQNIQDPKFICCCCGCCCAILKTVKNLPRPAEYFDTNYFAEVDGELCTECRNCSDRCEMDAIEGNGGPSSVDLLRCIGCGLCVSTCPEGAIQLREKEEARTPPRSQDDLYKTIMMERFGPLGTVKIVAKKALGMKI